MQVSSINCNYPCNCDVQFKASPLKKIQSNKGAKKVLMSLFGLATISKVGINSQSNRSEATNNFIVKPKIEVNGKIVLPNGERLSLKNYIESNGTECRGSFSNGPATYLKLCKSRNLSLNGVQKLIPEAIEITTYGDVILKNGRKISLCEENPNSKNEFKRIIKKSKYEFNGEKCNNYQSFYISNSFPDGLLPTTNSIEQGSTEYVDLYKMSQGDVIDAVNENIYKFVPVEKGSIFNIDDEQKEVTENSILVYNLKNKSISIMSKKNFIHEFNPTSSEKSVNEFDIIRKELLSVKETITTKSGLIFETVKDNNLRNVGYKKDNIYIERWYSEPSHQYRSTASDEELENIVKFHNSMPWGKDSSIKYYLRGNWYLGRQQREKIDLVININNNGNNNQKVLQGYYYADGHIEILNK